MRHQYHFSKKSSNRKTGPIPTTTTSAESCPPSCPLIDNGCYAEMSFQGMHWRKVTARKRGGSLTALCSQVAALPTGQLWRHNVSGDLPGKGNKINRTALRELTIANTGRDGFTYTHYPMTLQHNRVAVTLANQDGFTINLSANSPAHADTLADLDIAPVVTLLPIDQLENTETPAGRAIVICPAVTHDNVSCATCKLCQSNKRDRPIVGFPAHGSKARATQEVVETFLAA